MSLSCLDVGIDGTEMGFEPSEEQLDEVVVHVVKIIWDIEADDGLPNRLLTVSSENWARSI